MYMCIFNRKFDPVWSSMCSSQKCMRVEIIFINRLNALVHKHIKCIARYRHVKKYYLRMQNNGIELHRS